MSDLNAEIERRQAIADAATPGPWLSKEPDNWHGMAALVHVNDERHSPIAQVDIAGWKPKKMARDSAAFIAHARTGYPQCLEALKLAVAALEAEARNVDPESRLHARNVLAAIKRALEGK